MTQTHTRKVALLAAGLAVALALLVTAIGPAAAQEQPTPVNTSGVGPEPTPDVSESPVRVDENWLYHGVEFDESSGIAKIKLENTDDVKHSLTITDAGAFMDGGEMPSRSLALAPGTHTIEMPLTKTDAGNAGFTLSTPNVIYGVPVEAGTTLIGGPFDAQDVQTGAAAGAASVSVLTVLLVYRKLRGRDEEAERIA